MFFLFFFVLQPLNLVIINWSNPQWKCVTCCGPHAAQASAAVKNSAQHSSTGRALFPRDESGAHGGGGGGAQPLPGASPLHHHHHHALPEWTNTPPSVNASPSHPQLYLFYQELHSCASVLHRTVIETRPIYAAPLKGAICSQSARLHHHGPGFLTHRRLLEYHLSLFLCLAGTLCPFVETKWQPSIGKGKATTNMKITFSKTKLWRQKFALEGITTLYTWFYSWLWWLAVPRAHGSFSSSTKL